MRKTKPKQTLAERNPELAKEWNTIKNGTLSPTDIKAGSAKKVWWLCNICNYEWKYWIKYRNNGEGKCPECIRNYKFPLRNFEKTKDLFDNIIKKIKALL